MIFWPYSSTQKSEKFPQRIEFGFWLNMVILCLEKVPCCIRNTYTEYTQVFLALVALSYIVQLLQLHWLSHWLLSLSFSSAFTFIHSIFLILSLVSKVWERTTWRFSTTPNTPHVLLLYHTSSSPIYWAPLLSFSAIEVATQNMPF